MKSQAGQPKKPRPSRFGPYILLDRINVGGMAEVFRAKNASLDGVERLIAIKRILPHLARDEEFTTMFTDEARIAVALHHANIAQVYELGKVNDALYIAMEYVAGRDIRQLINRIRHLGQKFDQSLVIYLISKVCEALDYAHTKRDNQRQLMGIVHRDVSPQNVLISYEGEVKLIDFGIAKAASKRTHTEAGILKGKFGYMAPEQVVGGVVDHRADIFCVGVLLYELLTTERLFAGSTELSTLQKIRNVEVPPPTLYNSKITPELEEIILKALAALPEDRYQSAADLQDDLQHFLMRSGQTMYNTRRLRGYMHELFAREIGKDHKVLDELQQMELPPENKETPTHPDLFQLPSNQLSHSPITTADSGAHQRPVDIAQAAALRVGSNHTPGAAIEQYGDWTPSQPRAMAHQLRQEPPVEQATSVLPGQAAVAPRQNLISPPPGQGYASSLPPMGHAVAPGAQASPPLVSPQPPFVVPVAATPIAHEVTPQDMPYQDGPMMPTAPQTPAPTPPLAELGAFVEHPQTLQARAPQQKRKTKIKAGWIVLGVLLAFVLGIMLYFLLFVPAPGDLGTQAPTKPSSSLVTLQSNAAQPQLATFSCASATCPPSASHTQT